MRGKSVDYLYGLRLCSEHFEDSQFMNKGTKNKLVWNAVPTIFSVPNPPANVTPQRKLPTKRCAEKNITNSKEIKRQKVTEEKAKEENVSLKVQQRIDLGRV